MRWRQWVALAMATATLGLIAPRQSAAGNRLGLRVQPQFTPAPGNLRIIAAIQPDERNHSLIVEIESIAYYRRSEVPLDGAHAARIQSVTYTELPVGSYEVRVHLYAVDDEILEVREFEVTTDEAT